MTNHSLAIPKGSTVLVTGVNGFLGSHVADQFLKHGYNVRGTVRDPVKCSWVSELFNARHSGANFELYGVNDLGAEGALDAAIKGVSIVAHTASILTFDADPNNVIPGAVSFAVNALKAAYKEKTVKRFVLTSSSAAAVTSTSGKPSVFVTEDTWNEDAINEAWQDPPYVPERGLAVYAASKTQAEQEVWKYHKQHREGRPDLVVNTILPNMCFGKVLDPAHQGYPSSAGAVASLWKGKVEFIHQIFPPQYYIDVEDTARLHVAAAIFSHVNQQRIFGFAGRYNWDSVLKVLRKLYPDKTFPNDFSGGDDPNVIQPQQKAEQLLRDLGQPGWADFEGSIQRNVEDLK